MNSYRCNGCFPFRFDIFKGMKLSDYKASAEGTAYCQRHALLHGTHKQYGVGVRFCPSEGTKPSVPSFAPSSRSMPTTLLPLPPLVLVYRHWPRCCDLRPGRPWCLQEPASGSTILSYMHSCIYWPFLYEFPPIVVPPYKGLLITAPPHRRSKCRPLWNRLSKMWAAALFAASWVLRRFDPAPTASVGFAPTQGLQVRFVASRTTHSLLTYHDMPTYPFILFRRPTISCSQRIRVRWPIANPALFTIMHIPKIANGRRSSARPSKSKCTAHP